MTEIVQNKITNLDGISFTTDYWTSRNLDSYLTLTINFINSEFVFHSFVLETT